VGSAAPEPELDRATLRALRLSILGPLPSEPASPIVVTDDEYAVLSAVLSTELRRAPGRPTSVVVTEATFNGFEGILYEAARSKSLQALARSKARVREALPQLRDDTIESYLTANAAITKLDVRHLRAKARVIRDRAPAVKRILDRERTLNANLFTKAFPNGLGIFAFSRVGFSRDAAQAVVCVGFSRGFDSSSGHFRLYERTSTGWREVGAVNLWTT